MTRNKRALRKGDPVICDRGTPPTGAWRQFANRQGTVTVANNLGEVGVTLADDGLTYWFLPSDLKRTDNE